jgi:hypothetical protein
VSRDHREHYTPEQLYAAGQRMTDHYTVADAVEDYLAMHPDADTDQVRAEIEKVSA